MTQRLNLAHILQNQLNEERVQGGGLFNLSRSSKKEKMLKSNAQSPTDEYFAQKPNVMKTFDHMLANIHSTMKATPPPRKAVPAIPAPIAVIPEAPPQKQTIVRKRNKSARSKSVARFKGGSASSTGVITSYKTKTLPIAAMKADLDQKVTRMMRRGLNDLGGKTFTNQRRIREVLQQKVMLEQMLLQHRRLQRDRQTIAVDIQRMRQDLDKIRNKLDTSLQSLQSTPTISGAIAKAKKTPIMKMSSTGRRPFSAASSGRRLLSAAFAATAAAPSPTNQSSGFVHKRRMSVRSTKKRNASRGPAKQG
ncbi:uncharacterized protein LOC117581960 [Drosophila guanche]|uniref:Uncharacterized protein n=1 Tax=Drosophila guanche TaxID=7266 RepID=A0A3B0JBB7_DROGU|nr:uncharacterized protein LOC117581960 [Drosophila guanche]SPP79647.1 Hypothetical predicted protein [Drosophila guanche]